MMKGHSSAELEAMQSSTGTSLYQLEKGDGTGGWADVSRMSCGLGHGHGGRMPSPSSAVPAFSGTGLCALAAC